MDRARAQQRAIATQCTGILDALIYGNGVMLAYLALVGISGSATLLLLALPSWIAGLGGIPLAHLGDRAGARWLGDRAIPLNIAGLLLLALASLAPPWAAPALATAGIAIHGLGLAAFGATWMPLLEPIVPTSERGRFFGRLRMSWQAIALLAALVLAWWLARQPGRWELAAVMLAFAGLQGIRLLVYRGIPDLTARSSGRLLPSVLAVTRSPDLLPVGSYLFLIALCTGAVPWLLGLLALEHLGAGAGGVVALGLCGAVGSLAGFAIGGALIDRHGCKAVFLAAHGGFAAILALVLARGLLPWAELTTVYGAMFAWGAVAGAAGIARTAETMAVSPASARGLGMGILGSLGSTGTAISAAAASAALACGLVAPSWRLAGTTLTAYDALLALAAFGVLAVTVTLGLVPSVFRRETHGSAAASG